MRECIREIEGRGGEKERKTDNGREILGRRGGRDRKRERKKGRA